MKRVPYSRDKKNTIPRDRSYFFQAHNSRNSRSISVASLGLLLLSLLIYSCGPKSHDSSHPIQSHKEKANSHLTVKTALAQTETTAHNLVLTGTLTTFRQTKISTRLPGRITYLRVEEGDKVRQGQVLVKIDTQNILARLAQAKAAAQAAHTAISQADAAVATAHAQYRQAVKALETTRRRLAEAEAQKRLAAVTWKRMSRLYDQGAISRQKADEAHTAYLVARSRVAQLKAGIEQAKAAVKAAKAGWRQAKEGAAGSRAQAESVSATIAIAESELPYGTLRAPFDAVVVKKNAYQGDMAMPGVPLLELQDLSNLRLTVSVPETEVGAFHLNQKLPVTIEALDLTTEGVIKQIIPQADPSSRSFIVKLELENSSGKLFPGLFGRLELPRPSLRTVVIPENAVVRRGQLENVYVVGKDNRVELRLVKTGSPSGDKLSILSGLKAGEQVVLSPPPALEDGSLVEVIR